MRTNRTDRELRDLVNAFRSFRRAAFRLREVFQGPADGLGLSFKLSAEAGGATTGTFCGGDRIHRHATLLRPFMQEASKIELRTVWSRICASGLADNGVLASVEEAFARADRLPMALKVNGRPLSARDVYHAYAEGKYFADDPEAKTTLEALSMGPMAALVEMLFHEACGSYTELVFALLPAVLKADETIRGVVASDQRRHQCASTAEPPKATLGQRNTLSRNR